MPNTLGILARAYVPQLPLLVRQPPSGAQWVHELKLDGYRVGAAILRPDVRLVSRRGRDLTGEFPEIAAALRRVRVKEALLDGEIVILDQYGRTSFHELQNRAASRKGLTYFVFDLL